MPNYENSKIYKIYSPTLDKIYIGSTTETLPRRLQAHLSNYKSYLNNSHSYTTSFELLEAGDYKIELIELYPCNNRQQLCIREGELIRSTECVNKAIAGRTSQESYKIYYENNKEKCHARS